MKKLIIAFLWLTLLAAACMPTSSEAVPVEESVPAVVQATKTALPLPADDPAATEPAAGETDAPEATAEIQTAAVENEAAAAELPTTTPLPEVREDPAALVVSGQTEEGVFFQGSLNAPVTVIDYSDFL